MTAPLSQPIEFLIHRGKFLQAEWYYTPAGEMPGFDYYKELPDIDKLRFQEIVEFFCDRPFGERLPESMYRIEDAANKIYAFKPRSHRFFNFTTENAKVIITNAYRKKSQRMDKKALAYCKTAATCRQDYLRRVREGTYYV